jgi:hypothetical protein
MIKFPLKDQKDIMGNLPEFRKAINEKSENFDSEINYEWWLRNFVMEACYEKNHIVSINKIFKENFGKDKNLYENTIKTTSIDEGVKKKTRIECEK